MRQLVLTLLLTLSLATTVKSQDDDKKKPPVIKTEVEMVLPPGRGEITENIHIIVDKSGSMTSDELSIAIDETLTIAGQGLENLNVAITTFGGDHQRLRYVDKESKIGPNWLCMPSADNLKRIKAHLAAPINNYATFVRPPLQLALNEKVKKLTVIVISDLLFGRLDNLSADLKKMTKGKDVVVGFVGINAAVGKKSTMFKLCKKNKAWLINIKQEEEKEDVIILPGPIPIPIPIPFPKPTPIPTPTPTPK